MKPTRCTNLSYLFLEWNSTCFGQFLCPSSGVFHCTHGNGMCHTGWLTACEQHQDGTDPARSCQQTCMTNTFAVFTVKNSWWWTEELSETCRVSFQVKIWEISALFDFIIRNLTRCTVPWMSNRKLHKYRKNTFK